MDPLLVELNEEERKRELKLERMFLRDRSDVLNLPDTEFRRLFRLNKDLYLHLVNELSPYMRQGQRSSKLSISARILASLRFFAVGSYQRCVGGNFLISIAQQTMSETLTEVCNAMENIAPRWIKFPIDREVQQTKKLNFMREFGFPGIVGCIDGTHIAILAPVEDEHLYLNRKRFHSKNVQIICDNNLNILNVNANFPGSSHDAFIWKNSAVYEAMRNDHYIGGNRNTWLIGDSGYPLEPWLLTPIHNPLPGSPEERYNKSLCKARNCVERCIGKSKLCVKLSIN